MSPLNKLEDRFGRLAVPQLTVVLIVCQVIVAETLERMRLGRRHMAG